MQNVGTKGNLLGCFCRIQNLPMDLALQHNGGSGVWGPDQVILVKVATHNCPGAPQRPTGSGGELLEVLFVIL